LVARRERGEREERTREDWRQWQKARGGGLTGEPRKVEGAEAAIPAPRRERQREGRAISPRQRGRLRAPLANPQGEELGLTRKALQVHRGRQQVQQPVGNLTQRRREPYRALQQVLQRRREQRKAEDEARDEGSTGSG